MLVESVTQLNTNSAAVPSVRPRALEPSDMVPEASIPKTRPGRRSWALGRGHQCDHRLSSHNTMTGVRDPSRRRPATHARSVPWSCRRPSNASQLKVPGAVTASVALEVIEIQGPRSTTQGSVRRGRLLKRACCSPDEPLLHSATKHMHTVLRRNLHLISPLPLPSANLPQHARFCRSACCPC